MHSKNNRRNHDFQIDHFLAGACHTPDGAYALLCDLREDRQSALGQVEAHRLRTEAKMVRARRMMESDDEAERLEGQADLMEIEGHAELAQRNVDAAVAELAHIQDRIDKLQPHRKFAHLPDPEAHEAAQHDEWKGELIWRAQNYLLTQGTIPADHFSTMRHHPEFVDSILPAIEATRTAMDSGNLPLIFENKNNIEWNGE